MAKRGATSNINRDNWDEEETPEDMGIFKKASPEQLKTRQIHKAKRRSVRDGPAVPVFQNFTGFGVKNSSSSPVFNFLSQSKDSPTDAQSIASKKSETDSTKTPMFNFGQKSHELSKSPTFNFASNTNKSDSNTTKEVNLEAANSQTKGSSCLTKFNFSYKPLPETGNMKGFSFFDADKNKGKENISTLAFAPKPSSEDKSTTPTVEKSPPKVNGNRSRSPQKSNSSQDKVYLSHLKSLNLGLINWVKKHVDKNPYVDLSPIFEDYKSHFSDLKKKYKCSDISSDSGARKVSESSSEVTCNVSGDNKLNKTPQYSLNFSKQETEKQESAPISLGSSNSNKNISISFSHNNPLNTTSTTNTSSFSFGNKITSPSTSSSVVDFFKSTTPPSKPFTFPADSSKSIFGDNNKPSMFSFGNDENKAAPTFNFGATNTTSSEEEKKTEAESDEPPKVEVQEVKEEDALYEKKVKLFYKKENAWTDKGVGTLFLKKVESKTQLIVRAFTNLGNILLNIVLNESIPTQRQGKNNVLIVCIPNPPIDPKSEDKSPVPMLIRVKTSEDADELLKQIDTHKK